MNDSMKAGTCHHLLVAFIYSWHLFIHERPKPAKVPPQKHTQQNIFENIKNNIDTIVIIAHP